MRKTSRNLIVPVLAVFALSGSPLIPFSAMSFDNPAQAQGASGGAGGGAGGGGAGGGAGGGPGGSGGGGGHGGGGGGSPGGDVGGGPGASGDNPGSATAAAATNPETRGLAKAQEVVGTTPAATQTQAHEIIGSALARFLGIDNGDEDTEEVR